LIIGLSEDPFPDLAKIVARCEQIEAEKNPRVIRGEVSKKPSKQLIATAAKALGMEVE